MNKQIIFESDEPSVVDKQFDAYMNSVMSKQISKSIMKLKPIDRNETSLENKTNSSDLIQEDDYRIEEKTAHLIFENKHGYSIGNIDLYDALMALKPIDRRIFLLKEYDSWTDVAIGKLLGISRRTVNSKQRSVKIKIRTFLLKRRYGHER